MAIMTIEDEIQRHEEICEWIHELFMGKRRDYGQCTEELLDRYGHASMLTFLRTKLDRLDNLLLNKCEPNNESITDTLMDLANYAIIYKLELEKQELKKTKVYNHDTGSLMGEIRHAKG